MFSIISWLNPFKAKVASPKKSEAQDEYTEESEKILAEYEAMNDVLASQLYESEQVLLKLQSKSANPALVRTYTVTQPAIQTPSSRPLYLSEKEWQLRCDEKTSECREDLARDTLVAEAACQSLEEVKREAYKHLEQKTDTKFKKRLKRRSTPE